MLIWGVYSIRLSNENNVSVPFVLKKKKKGDVYSYTLVYVYGISLNGTPKPGTASSGGLG